MKKWWSKIRSYDFFGKVTQILNVYVLLLGVLAVLVSIGLFPINDNPEIRVMKPVYSFPMKRIAEIVSNESYRKILRMSPLFADFIETKIEPTSVLATTLPVGKKDSMKYLLPYKRVGFKNKYGWQSRTNESLFYELGVDDSIPKYWEGLVINASKNRTDFQKLYGVHSLLVDAVLKELDAFEGAAIGVYNFEFNPLDELHKLRPVVKDSVTYYNLSRELGGAANVYSVLSISNPSEENMSNVDLFINQVYNYGDFNVIGWTNLSRVTVSEPDDPNIHINIQQIEAGTSIEFVFFSQLSFLRENQIKLSYPRFTAINKDYVIRIMVGLFVFVVLLSRFSKQK